MTLYHSLSADDVEQAKCWIQDIYHMADSKNAGMVHNFIQEEAVLYLPQAPPLKGRAALENLYTWEYGTCAQIIHSIQDIRVTSNHICVQLAATYCFKDGSHKLMPYRAVWYKTPQETQASRVDLDGDFLGIFKELSSIAGPPPL